MFLKKFEPLNSIFFFKKKVELIFREKTFKGTKTKAVRNATGTRRKFSKTEQETIKKIFDILVNEAPQ